MIRKTKNDENVEEDKEEEGEKSCLHKILRDLMQSSDNKDGTREKTKEGIK